MKIELDEKTSYYISNFLMSNIKEIYIDSNSEDLLREFAFFIKNLLSDNQYDSFIRDYYVVYNKDMGMVQFNKKEPSDENKWRMV